jgi:methyltransferase
VRFSHVLLIGILAAVAAMRFVELAVSSRRVRRTPESVERDPVFPWMVMVHVSIFWCVPLEVFGLNRNFSPALFAAASTVLAGATVLRFKVLSALGGYWNVGVLRPKGFVTNGPYRHIRHPNYLAVTLEIPAICLLHGAWISSVALSAANGIVLFFRIRAEERVLNRVPGYAEAMGGKGRFIPARRG